MIKINLKKLYHLCRKKSTKQGIFTTVCHLIKVLKIGPDDMSYKQKKWRTKNAIEVMEYHTARYGAPGQARQKRRKPTPEEMEKINQYNKERTARLKLRQWFDVNDYYTDLTYRREERPLDMQMAKEHFKKFIRKVRKEYKKRGATLRWMRNIEVGTKNGWHIHIIINRIPETDVILANAWEHGRVINQLMYAVGEFRKLASYITKTPKTDKRLKESDYSASRNMPIKKPEEKIFFHWKTFGRFSSPKDQDPIDKDYHVRIPKGFYLDKESYHEGKNPYGYPYRTYTLLRLRRE